MELPESLPEQAADCRIWAYPVQYNWEYRSDACRHDARNGSAAPPFSRLRATAPLEGEPKKTVTRSLVLLIP